jgi:hypothetical protein
MKTTVVGGARKASGSGSTSPPGGFAATRHDPVNRTGLLPRDFSRSHEGVKTYVLPGAGTNPGHRRIQPTGFNRTTSFDIVNGGAREREIKDSKERRRKREEEERSLGTMLKREGKRGVSNIGAHYLGKLRRKSGGEGAGGSDAVDGDEKGKDDDDDDDDDDDGGRGKKAKSTSAFTPNSIRAIGFDPTREGERESREAELKRVRYQHTPPPCLVWLSFPLT